mmetsp:Transcript_45471/g.74089  ORF Transcript_45471/g.74089 Transcript_45471/m.74089 type:complete len:209 (-) Transcript_45471:145-771(-)
MFKHADKYVSRIIWPGAKLLCSFLRLIPHEKLLQLTLVELGSGTGLAAIMAAKLNARVHATDGDENSVALITRNIERNHVMGTCTPMRLLWGENTYLFPHADHVIGSDIVYSPEYLDPLFKTVDMMLPQQGAEVESEENCSAGRMLEVFSQFNTFCLGFSTRGVSLDSLLKCAQKYRFAYFRASVNEFVDDWAGPVRLSALLLFVRSC